MKVIPSSLSSEESAIGIILSGSYIEASEIIISKLKPHHFWSRNCRVIFETILKLYEESKSFDLISITNEFQRTGSLEENGGTFWLSEIASKFNSSHESHIETILEKYRLRKTIELAQAYSEKAYSGEDSKKVLGDFENDLFQLGSSEIETENLVSLACDSVELMIQRRIRKEKISGLLSGIPLLDEAIHGFQPSQYYVIGGRPSAGKTAMADQIAMNLIDRDVPFLYIGLEGSRERIAGKIACKMAGICYSSFVKGFCSEKDLLRISSCNDQIKKSKMILIRPSDIGGTEIRSLIRKESRINKIELVILDYIQKVFIPSDWDERRAISQASMQIQRACVDTGVPALVLGQLNREGERGGRPKARHLKESGQIEQDADFLGLLFSEEEKEDLDPNSSIPILMAIEKNKDGPSFIDLKFEFDGRMMKFNERK